MEGLGGWVVGRCVCHLAFVSTHTANGVDMVSARLRCVLRASLWSVRPDLNGID